MDKDEAIRNQHDQLMRLGKQNTNHHLNWLHIEKQLNQLGYRLDWKDGKPTIKER